MNKLFFAYSCGFFGSPNWARTSDIMINSHAANGFKSTFVDV